MLKFKPKRKRKLNPKLPQPKIANPPKRQIRNHKPKRKQAWNDWRNRESKVRSTLKLYGFRLQRVRKDGIRFAIIDANRHLMLPDLLTLREIEFQFLFALKERLEQGRKLRLTDEHITIEQEGD
jgi:hypothetical protein